MNIKEAFAARFREARKALGLSQREVAEALEVSRAVVSDWEQGRSSPTLERLADISQVLQQPISYFFASAGQEWQFGVSPEEMLSLVGRLCQSIRELHEHAAKVTQGLGYLHDVADQLYVLGLPPNSVYERERHASEDRPTWDKLMAKIEAEEPPEKIVEFRTALALKSIADSIWSLEEYLAGRDAIDPRIDHLLEMLQQLKPREGEKQ